MAKSTRKGDRLVFWCPACRDFHLPAVEGAAPWEWNDDLDRPTLKPSILVTGQLYGPDKKPFFEYDGPNPAELTPTTCHSYVTDGRIQFLADCTHEFVGQTVDLPSIDSWPLQP